MKSAFTNIKILPVKSVTRQLTDHFREMIGNGTISPGTRLPPHRDLAHNLGIPASTVNVALRPLVKEGLLERRPHKGTFARQRDKRLTCIGIYFREDIWATRSSDFQLTVHALVKEELNRIGIRTQVWIDPRPLKEQTDPWPELCRAMEQRKIQGLIVPAIDWPHVQWLNKLPVPSSFQTTLGIHNRVEMDQPQLAKLSLRALAEQGCRSVGLIMPVCADEGVNPDGSRNSTMDLLTTFTDQAGALGLRLKNEWMRLPKKALNLKDGRLQEQYGYKEFLKLWGQSERPDGLVVYPDTTVRGAILGLMEKRVRVPQELKLVLHKNETNLLLCPMPATFVVLSERAVARAMIAQVQKQFCGERCDPVAIGHTLVPAGNNK